MGMLNVEWEWKIQQEILETFTIQLGTFFFGVFECLKTNFFGGHWPGWMTGLDGLGGFEATVRPSIFGMDRHPSHEEGSRNDGWYFWIFFVFFFWEENRIGHTFLEEFSQKNACCWRKCVGGLWYSWYSCRLEKMSSVLTVCWIASDRFDAILLPLAVETLTPWGCKGMRVMQL